MASIQYINNKLLTWVKTGLLIIVITLYSGHIQRKNLHGFLKILSNKIFLKILYRVTI